MKIRTKLAPLGAILVVCINAGPVAAQDVVLPTLEVFHVNIDANSWISWESGRWAVPSSPNPSLEWRCANTPSFRVCIDPNELVLGKSGNLVIYTWHIEPRAASPRCGSAEIPVAMRPTGTFEDQDRTVEFKVTCDGVEEKESVKIPVFCLSGGDFLESSLDGKANDGEPLKLQIGSEERIWVNLQNRIEMPIEIFAPVVRTNRDDLWQEPPEANLMPPGAPGKDDLPSIRLAQKSVAGQAILVTVRSRYLPALKEATFPYFFDPSHPESGIHEQLVVQIPYRNSLNVPRVEELRIPIRFHPWFGQLLLVTSLGAVCGSLLRSLLNRKKTTNSTLAVMISAVLSSWGAQLIAMILYNNNSKVRIIGLEIDPFQLSSATALGFLFGVLGIKSLEDWLQSLRKSP